MSNIIVREAMAAGLSMTASFDGGGVVVWF